MRQVGMVALGAGLVGCVLGGCSSGSSGSGVRVVRGADQATIAGTLDKLKALQGEWMGRDENGKPMTAAVFTVTSNGSAVREVMFPGTAHEMTNLYHMDGGELVVTHYCAMGNQPTMRSYEVTGSSISLRPDSVRNLRSEGEMYMGGLKITFVDTNTIQQAWTSYVKGKPQTDHGPTFTLTRKTS